MCQRPTGPSGGPDRFVALVPLLPLMPWQGLAEVHHVIPPLSLNLIGIQ